MNILLTGGAGYIGSHTAVTLSAVGHKVIIYDNLSNSSHLVLNQLENILNKKIDFVEGDVRDVNFLKKKLKTYRVDAVMHFAGLKSVGESVQNPLIYYENNVVGTIGLLEAMREADVYTLIFSSSATVYGAPHYLPYDEEHPTIPISPYGHTKLAVENFLRDLSASDPNWRICILRYFNPVGAHESGLIGENPSGIPNNLMPYILQVAAGKLPYLNIFGNDYETKDGTGERDFIHVDDLANGHLLALDFLRKNTGYHIFNLGSGKPVSVLELIDAFKKSVGIDIPYVFTARRLGDLPVYFAKPNQAYETLLWKNNKTIDDVCLSAWRWWKYWINNGAI